jgi:hypothetical protein
VHVKKKQNEATYQTPAAALRQVMRAHRTWLASRGDAPSLGTCVDCARVIPATELFTTCAGCASAVCVDCLDAHQALRHERLIS